MSEQINAFSSGRLYSLDLTRFLAMFMMVTGHVVFALINPQYVDTDSPFWSTWEFMRGVTAPIFLMVSGAVHVFANKRDAQGNISNQTFKKRIKTALTLMAVGYILVFPVSKIYDLPFLSYESWKTFLQVNVLQMISVSLIAVITCFKLIKNERNLLFTAFSISLIIIFATPFLSTIDWFAYLPEPIAAFLSFNHGSLFPVLPFSGYMFMGVAFGLLVKQQAVENRTQFIMKRSYLFAIPFLAVGIAMYYWFMNTYGYTIEVMRINPGLAFIRIGIVFALLSITAVILKYTVKLKDIYSLFGKRAIYIYVVHLLLLFGTPVFPGFNYFFAGTLTPGNAYMCAAIIMAMTMGFAYFFHTVIHETPKLHELYKYVITAYLIYLFFI